MAPGTNTTSAGDRRRALGRRGEEAAAAWYGRAGYAVLARNWRCAEGEIDLVVVGGDGSVAVCEVKTRSSPVFGSALEAVTPAKQRRLRRLAARWLAENRPHSPSHRSVRFDVAAVTPDRSGRLAVDVVTEAF